MSTSSRVTRSKAKLKMASGANGQATTSQLVPRNTTDPPPPRPTTDPPPTMPQVVQLDEEATTSYNNGDMQPFCNIKTPPRSCSSRATSVRSAASAMKMLLAKLEEEKKCQLEYIEKKYAILADMPMASDDGSSICGSIADMPCPPAHVPKIPTIQLSESVPQVHTGLTPEQRDARKSVPKLLPRFGGDPGEWPLFISAFNNTTAMCAFTSHENLIRLQSSLHGRALEDVRSQLMHPDNVNEIIGTLRMLYGQPERIIQSVLDKISKLPAVEEDNLESLVRFGVAVKNYCDTVKSCDVPEHLYNVTLLHQLVRKLPTHLQLRWAEHRHDMQENNMMVFNNWLHHLAEVSSAIAFSTEKAQSKPSNTSSERKNKRQVNTHTLPNANNKAHSNTSRKPDRTNSNAPHVVSTDTRSEDRQNTSVLQTHCVGCSKSCESLNLCDKFLRLTHNERWVIVKNNAVCRICLRKHAPPYCSEKLCGINGCEYKHSPLLHNENKKTEATTTPTSSSVTASNIHLGDPGIVLLKYVPVVLKGPDKQISTFALLDDGSEITLIDETLADELQLDGISRPIEMQWSNGTTRTERKSRVVNLRIRGEQSVKEMDIRNVRTVSEFHMHAQTLEMANLCQRFEHLKGIPIASYNRAKPRILIGSIHSSLVAPLKIKEGRFGEPIAAKTRLGWTVYGPLNGEPESYKNNSLNVHLLNKHDCDEELHQAMKNYFSMDSLGVMARTNLASKDDERATTLLNENTTFNGTRYQSCLLWKQENKRVQPNTEIALRRHQNLQKRLQNDPQLKSTLQNTIEDYFQKGYIRKLLPDEILNVKWLLPIFPVKNPNKPGKFRIVWDAAAKSTDGISLNSMLLQGPDLLCSLMGILLRFRQHQIAIAGDIREMFHQIGIRPEDQMYQCFYWTEPDGQLAVYAMTVMTFGACSSPCTAQFVKNRNAERFQTTHPKAYDAIVHSHYVDDLLISVQSENEGIQLVNDVKMIHNSGGFDIRNWTSNCDSVVAAVKGNLAADKSLNLCSEPHVEKVLGMWWDVTTDVLTYKVGWHRYDRALLSGERTPTKREMLQILMSIFDPLGLIAHFLGYLKAVLQEVWRSAVDWDESIRAEELAKWTIWIKLLPQIEQVKLPRCYLQAIDVPEYMQLHTFVDAGGSGMAAAVYLRVVQGQHIHCSLLTSKTKVAPLKLTSVPRMELQAALIGARLSNTVEKALQVKISQRFFWSDSKDVLCWINSDHRRYSLFVGFRVSEILELTENKEWRYVPSKQNVADDATKWNNPPDLSMSSRWFTGPGFLYETEDKWPPNAKEKKTTENELKASVLIHKVPDTPILSLDNYSSWRRLTRVVGWIRRFVYNLRNKSDRKQGSLQANEFASAEAYVLQLVQKESYRKEYNDLLFAAENADKVTTKIHKSSALYKLAPWIDSHGVMRMKTRATACHYATENAKNPVILSHAHHVTKLIVAFYHEKFHHLNTETVINEVRQKYCISRLRPLLNTVRRNCQHCKNQNAEPKPPRMSDLPPGRLAAFSRPFTHTGIDYFGPMEVVVGRGNQKRWGMLATCLTTRAIHIELVRTLTTSSCIIAIRNFISRRGRPQKFYSDRGTNFVGAYRELTKLNEDFNQQEIAREFVDADTTWAFNTPAAPHMGGSWERLIRTVKTNMMAVCTSKKLSDEILNNLLVEIENTVNSRPLTHVPIDHDSAPALTPNHFLLGSSNGSKPLVELADHGPSLRQNYSTSQIMSNQFWKRWLNDYLPEITRRSKWFLPTTPIKLHDIVLIVDPRLPRNCWPRGRVVATKVSGDGQVRAATVKTTTGALYERPVAKLAILDVRRGVEE